MPSFFPWFRSARKRRFFRYGLPFLVLVFGGSLVLKEFTSLRYQFRKVQMMTPQEAAEKTGVKLKHKEKQSLEDMYMELLEKDNDSWENIRGPRPWEDSRQVQNEQRALQKL